MNQSTLTAIDTLIDSFQKDAYTVAHVNSLLNYLVELDEKEDYKTVLAITKVLSFCTKDFVREPIINTLKSINASNTIKASLLAVCWESGLNYHNYLNVFVDALINGNEAVAIEAYTMIMEFTMYDTHLKEAIETINNTDQAIYSPAHRILINDSLQHLIQLYSNAKENNQ